MKTTIKYTRMASMLCMLALSQAYFCFGQNSMNFSGTWLPPDKTFSVEVPVPLKESKGEYGDQDPDGYESIRSYGESLGNYSFQIVVINLRETEKKVALDEKLDGLQFLVGGDDDFDFTRKYLTIDGLSAKEIVYKKQNSKGLMIDGCDKIYVLGMTVKLRKDLDSDIANRFFTSFRRLTTSRLTTNK
ncbi:MAG: hypothetical protein WKF34_06510 [Pyrinomonadaceae bacterium]